MDSISGVFLIGFFVVVWNQYKTLNCGLSIWLTNILPLFHRPLKFYVIFDLRVRSFRIFYFKIKNCENSRFIDKPIVYVLSHCRACNRRGRGINNMLLTGVNPGSSRVLREFNVIIPFFIFFSLFYPVKTTDISVSWIYTSLRVCVGVDGNL